jgi:hypothetical protein
MELIASVLLVVQILLLITQIATGESWLVIPIVIIMIAVVGMTR